MKRLLLLVGIIVSLSAPAQQHPKLALINEAELAIVDENLEKAANIYGQLFLQKDELWAQDLYNAAMVEMKLGSFEYAKKYLNELAKRGVAIEEIEEKEVFQEAYEWENYKITYQQYMALSRSHSQTPEQAQVWIETFKKAYTMEAEFGKFSPTLELNGYPPHISTLNGDYFEIDSATQANDVWVYFRKISDSLTSLPKNIHRMSKIDSLQKAFALEFLGYLKIHGFPSNDILNESSLKTRGGEFYQISKIAYRYLGREYRPMRNANSPNLKLLIDERNQFFDLLTTEFKEGKIKAETLIEILSPADFAKLLSVNAATVLVERKENCELSLNQVFILKKNKEELKISSTWKEKLPLWDQESMDKKFMYQMTKESPFIFNVPNIIEQVQFSNCESAKMFIKDAVKLK